MGVLEMMAAALMVTGLVFYTGGAVGIIRFPDFYARLHPAGKLDTAGLVLTMSAMALHIVAVDFSWDTFLTAVKLLLIAVFVFLTSPTATHAIVDAGMRAGLKPWRKGEPQRHDLAD